MNLKELIKFGMEESQEPLIKNPILREALEPRTMDQASLKDDLEPGPLKDELLKDFDPSQETYEEYLQRKSLERPFNMAEGGRMGFKKGGRKGPAKDAINRRTQLVDDYNKIVKYALNNRKIKNFSEPVEVTIKGKLTTINELPTVSEWADMNNVGRDTLSTRRGSLIPVKRADVYKTIVDETIKLNNKTFRYSTPSDIAMDIGLTKNQGRGTGVEDLLRKENVTKLLSKDEIVSNYIQHLIDNDAPLKDFTNNSIFKHINSRNANLIKKTPAGSLTIPDSARTIDFNRVSKVMKANHPELFAKLGRNGQIPFLSRSIQNKPDLGNLRLSEAFETTESGDIFFNEAKARNINLKRALSNITAETDILQGKLKLDQRSLAISNAQDKMVMDLNKYIRENPSVILDNPQFRNLAATRFEDGKFIIDENPKLIDERLNKYIESGFFSTDHKVSKRTGKLNIEFPTNKQIVPTFINGPIRSMENYIVNNISKYDTDPLIKNNIDEIVNVAKTNNFTVNVPKGYSNIFGTNRTNVGAIQDIATVSVDGKTLTSYDNQLKNFNFDIDKIPEISNVKNIDYTEVDKSKLQKTLDTKLKTAETYKKVDKSKLLNFFEEAGIPCIKGVGGQCNSIADYQKGYNKLVKEAAAGKGSTEAIQKLSRFTKAMRGITGVAKWTGYGLLAEAGFMVPFAIGDYAAGESWKRILGNATDYGFGPILGQSEQEEFEAALPEGSAAPQRRKLYELGERLYKLENQKVNPGYGRPGFRQRAETSRQKVYDSILDEYILNMQPFMRPTPHTEHGKFYDQYLMDKAEQEDLAAMKKLEAERQARKDKRTERGIIADRNWQSQIDPRYAHAQGGIASLKRK